ncbi:MAG: ShlB/FhaC/HecB family hemolysin secretion/activation protein [Sulfitobacter sp.]|nr:ShlB/FhaC/HecB family hemolysin secretion/activation protein [Sulfitobacter sp.]
MTENGIRRLLPMHINRLRTRWRSVPAAGLIALLPAMAAAQGKAVESLLPRQAPAADTVAPVAMPQPEDTLPKLHTLLAPAITGFDAREWDGGPVDVEAGVAAGVRLESGSLSGRAQDAIRTFLANKLDQPLTLSRLNYINQDLVLLLREQGYPVVDVVVPAGQDVSGGGVRLLLLLGRLQEVAVTGQRHFSAAAIRRGVKSQADDVISSRRLSRDLDWLNRNPFRTVDAVLQRGARPGQTRVELKVRDQRPYRVYAGYENTGTELTGENRGLAGFTLGNVFGRDHRLGYQGTVSDQSGAFKAHSLHYVVPLSWQHELKVFAVDQTSDPEQDADGFDLSANSTQYGVRYIIPLVTRSGLSSGLRQNLELGYDAKESDNGLFFGGAPVSDNLTEVSQWRLGYQFARPDSRGHFKGAIHGIWSPGQDSRDASFAQQRALADSTYTYILAYLERHTRLGRHWSWRLGLTGQWADSNLLPSEQLGIGGYNTVRGYEEYAQIGDQGVMVNNELHFRPLPAHSSHGLDLFAFHDYGRASNVDLLPGERDRRDLSSVGLGVNYHYRSFLTLSLAYGRQLKEVEPGEDKDGRFHGSLLVSY